LGLAAVWSAGDHHQPSPFPSRLLRSGREAGRTDEGTPAPSRIPPGPARTRHSHHPLLCHSLRDSPVVTPGPAPFVGCIRNSNPVGHGRTITGRPLSSRAVSSVSRSSGCPVTGPRTPSG